MSRSLRLRSAEELGRRMRATGKSQVELAQRARCTKQFISKLVNGKASSCSVEIAHAIEEALQVVAGSLFVSADCPAGTDLLTRQERRGEGEQA